MTAPEGYRARIEGMLSEGRIGAALSAIEATVEEVFCEPLNTAEIFADAWLDEACQRAGAEALRHAGARPTDGDRSGTVFLASRLQSSGGHTAVLADIARWCSKPVRVLLTGVGGRTNVSSLADRFRNVPDIVFESAPVRDRLGKLGWAQERLRALRPQTVWLLNHHQDSVAVAAVQPGEGYDLKYLHHGDHHLCLGVTLAWGEHFDPHPMGYHNCRETLGRTDNRYLPLVVADPGQAPASAAVRPAPLVTCTVARANKIEHDYWPAYAEVVAELLACTGGRHVHIGKLSPWYRWRIRRALASRGVDARTFRYIPYVPSVASVMAQEEVDLYIASFPYSGARTLVEAMAAGIPIAAHDHSAHRFLGALDMLPPGSAVWSAPADLMRSVKNLDRASLRVAGAQARAHYERFHTEETLRRALAGDAGAQRLPPSEFAHQPDALTQALRRARAFKARGLASRSLLRLARGVRSAMS